MIIKSTSTSTEEILRNIMALHNNGEPFEADITYSKGGFYKKTGVPEPTYKFDVVPLFDDVVKLEPLGPIPLEDNSLSSIVCDLPFIISPKNSPSCLLDDGKKRNIIFNRFHSYYPQKELFQSYYHWIKESYRVLKQDGILVFKTQATVSARRNIMTPEFSCMAALSVGFDCIDQFVLLAKARLISGKIKKQEHARKFHSFYYVFKKSTKLRPKYFDFDEAEEMLENLKKQL